MQLNLCVVQLWAVWNRCRCMRKALLFWCMHEIGGDCLLPASRIHKENEPVVTKAVDWDCIMEPKASLRTGESPRCVRHSLNMVRLFIITDRKRNKSTGRLSDKFSLSSSKSVGSSSTINYSIIEIWSYFKLNTTTAKFVFSPSNVLSPFPLSRSLIFLHLLLPRLFFMYFCF